MPKVRSRHSRKPIAAGAARREKRTGELGYRLFSLKVAPAVRIRLPPAGSQEQTVRPPPILAPRGRGPRHARSGSARYEGGTPADAQAAQETGLRTEVACGDENARCSDS